MSDAFSMAHSSSSHLPHQNQAAATTTTTTAPHGTVTEEPGFQFHPTSSASLPRSVSYVQIPQIPKVSSAEAKGTNLRRSKSQGQLSRREGLSDTAGNPLPGSAPERASWMASTASIFRSKSRSKLSRKASLMSTSSQPLQEGESDAPPKALQRSAMSGERSRSVASSISSLAKRTSWIIGPRSLSPNKRKPLPFTTGFDICADSHEPDQSRIESGVPKADDQCWKGGEVHETAVEANDEKPRLPIPPPRLRTPRPENIGDPKDRRSILSTAFSISKSSSQDRLFNLEGLSLRSKVDQDTPFRTLEEEYSKFVSKSWSIKVGLIRTILLPFLRNDSTESGKAGLQAHRLQIRTNVLNKWWTGLMGILEGALGHSGSSGDRSLILEAIQRIMARPEWMMEAHEISVAGTQASSTITLVDLPTTTPQSALEIQLLLFDIRAIYARNVLSQMHIVVERMSYYSVPASVVTFCGKVVAYAFFFCPGVAHSLVRLWVTPAHYLKRAAQHCEHEMNTSSGKTRQRIKSRFPGHLDSLSFLSLSATLRQLRQSHSDVPVHASANWRGNWLGRWNGNETGLLFAFVKSYFVLFDEMLSEVPTSNELHYVPGYIYVQAQLLSVFDAAIRRSLGSSSIPPPSGATSATFDDLLGADPLSSSLSLIGANSGRGIHQSRLIMLLKDLLLAEPLVYTKTTQQAFAGAFLELLRSGASGTSAFDHEACFSLSDFLEEALSTLVRFFDDVDDPVSFLDWPFWLSVFKQMMLSNHSMMAIRLYSLLYSIWPWIAKNADKRRDLCIGWLLQEDVFHTQFRHWCPMVRAYFMRLACWRIARWISVEAEVDSPICHTLYRRLQETWGHMAHLQQEAVHRGIIGPSTVPCHPAPGRQLIIIKAETPPSTDSLILSFKETAAMSSSDVSSTYDRYASLESIKQRFSHPLSTATLVNGKKRFNVLRNIIPFPSLTPDEGLQTSSNALGDATSESAHVSTDSRLESKRSPTDDPSSATSKRKSSIWRSDRDEAKSASILRRRASSASHPISTQPASVQRFKFSLEWRTETKATLTPGAIPLMPLLPGASHTIFAGGRQHLRPLLPIAPLDGPMRQSSTYAGRALAEWAEVLLEMENFHERRRLDGGPAAYGIVSVPSLGVESFRKAAE